MKRFASLLLLASALGLGTGFGCYTMIRHPGPEDVSFNDSEGTTCLDCHAGADFDHWTDPYYTSVYSFYPGTWGSYYTHPWWYDEFYYRVPGAGRDSTIVRGGRHAWDRGTAAPTLPPVGGGQVNVPSGGGHGAGTASPDTSGTPPPEKKTQREEPNRRHGWGR
jgi:hypothetical protein